MSPECVDDCVFRSRELADRDRVFCLEEAERLFEAFLPARRLDRIEGLRAQMYAWNEDTVKTPSWFSVDLVALETCVSRFFGLGSSCTCREAI